MTLPPTVHSKVGTRDSSGSVTVAKTGQCIVIVGCTIGVIDSPLKLGAVLAIVMLDEAEVPSVIALFGVTITVHCSPLLVAELGSVLVVYGSLGLTTQLPLIGIGWYGPFRIDRW